MLPHDTSPAAAAVHEAALRQLGPARRLKIALDLSDLTHSFAVSGIRQRTPDYDDEQARQELARVLYGPKV
jgi:hypothetical protein